jgi:hypothetical protein
MRFYAPQWALFVFASLLFLIHAPQLIAQQTPSAYGTPVPSPASSDSSPSPYGTPVPSPASSDSFASPYGTPVPATPSGKPSSPVQPAPLAPGNASDTNPPAPHAAAAPQNNQENPPAQPTSAVPDAANKKQIEDLHIRAPSLSMSVGNWNTLSDAQINETVLVYIPSACNDTMLLKGTSAKVVMTIGKNALIDLPLQNGDYVETQISTKYLTIFPPKPEFFAGHRQVGPNLATPAPIVPPVLPKEGTSMLEATDEFYSLKEVVLHQSFLAVRGTVNAPVQDDNVVAKAYFYDQNRKLIATDTAPNMKAWSGLIPKDTPQFMDFTIPGNVLSQYVWSAIIVWGDAKGVVAQSYPAIGEETTYDFPEKKMLADKNPFPVERKIAMNPLVEHVEYTSNPALPQITLFMRPPLGMTDASQAKGVLCLSVLAGLVDDVKRQLQGTEPNKDLDSILKFAQEHKLIIVCWGSHGLWNAQKNWDDLSPLDARRTSQGFDQVADAWAKGMDYFVKEYGIPSDGYLLWGLSGSAQYACRLALRKPEYFLAVDAHVPSSFDKPTPEASRILWCLTTGELESGHERSLRFYAQCRALGYPILYKAIVGLGHAASPIAENLGEKFFAYALTVRDQRLAYDKS